MSAAIKAPGFADLRTRLSAATALPGRIAAEHRHLIDEEIEVRQAVARLEHITAGGAL